MESIPLLYNGQDYQYKRTVFRIVFELCTSFEDVWQSNRYTSMQRAGATKSRVRQNHLLCRRFLTWCCRNSVAILDASWARFTKLAASMAIQAILDAFPAAQAILGAFPAALGSMIMLVGLLALFCCTLAVAVEIAYQRLSVNPQAAVLL